MQFRADEPWGDDGEFYTVAGHIDRAEALAMFADGYRSLCGEDLIEVEPGDVQHAWATPDPDPPSGFELGEYVHFHLERHDETSVPVTVLNLHDYPLRAQPRLHWYSEPAGPPVPSRDRTLGGRIVKHNGMPVA